MLLNAKYGAISLLKNLIDENKDYLGRGEPYTTKQTEYRKALQSLADPKATIVDIDNAVNQMHVDYDLLWHNIEEVRRSLENEGLTEKQVDARVENIEKMADRFRQRVGAVEKQTPKTKEASDLERPTAKDAEELRSWGENGETESSRMAANIAEEIEYPEGMEDEIGGEVTPLVNRDASGKITSAASLRDNPFTGDLYISYMATHPEMLGEGAGTAMLDKIMKIAADRDSGLSLEATPHSAPFWKKMGAKETPDGFLGWTPEEVKARVEAKEKPWAYDEKRELRKISMLDPSDLGYMRADGTVATASRGQFEEHRELASEQGEDIHKILREGGIRFGIDETGDENYGYVNAGNLEPETLQRAIKIIDSLPVTDIQFEAAHGKDYLEASGTPKEAIREIRKHLAAQEETAKPETASKHANSTGAPETIEHPKAPVDIRELKYPEADKDAKTGEPITIHAYRASDHPEFRTNEERGTFFAPEATPEFGNHIYRAKLEFKNPLVADSGIEAAQALGEKELAKKYEDVLSGWDSEKDAPLEMPADAYEVLDKQLAASAKKAGHDGIVFHGHDDLNPVQYIAVDPRAITNPEKVGQYSWSSLKVEPEEAAEEAAAEKEKPTGDWKELHDLGKDHDIPSEEGYVYHATNAERAGVIAESGKLNVHRPDYGTDQSTWPDGTTEKRSYFTKKANTAWQFAPEEGKSVLVRTKLDPEIHKTESTGDLYSKKAIPANKLEVLGADKEWHPIEDLAEKQPVDEDAGMKRLVDKLNAKDWWHVPPEQGPSAYAHRGKFMSSQQSDFYGAQLNEPQNVSIKNPIVGTEDEIAEKIGLPPQYAGMPYEEMKKLDRQWAMRAKELGYDAIVTVGRAALDKFMAGGRIPRNMEIQDLTHVDESLPTPKAQAHPDPIGVHPDDLPARAKYADVDFDKPDLQDSAKRVTADSIKKDYVREKDRNKVSVYQSYIPMEDLPTPKFVDEQEENFDRQDYRPRIGSPIKVDIHPNGSVNILDGNHRVTVWDEQGQQYAPAWVVDHRHPGIEMLSEDEKAEREEED